MVGQTKRCSRCEESKPAASFYKNGKSPDGLDYYCKTCTADRQARWRADNVKRQSVGNRAWRLVLKMEALARYGEVCACCGEADHRFLTIDHVDGDGAEHRRSIGYMRFYLWLKNNDYPEGFQVLCWNCNCGRHINGGICPHQED